MPALLRSGQLPTWGGQQELGRAGKDCPLWPWAGSLKQHLGLTSRWGEASSVSLWLVTMGRRSPVWLVDTSEELPGR